MRTILVDSVRVPFEEFRHGFEEVLPLAELGGFTEPELDVLFNGKQVRTMGTLAGEGGLAGSVCWPLSHAQERWDRDGLLESLRYDHGYSRESPTVRHLVDVLCELSAPEQSAFIRFVTGSPRLPSGGLSKLSPPLTIVLKRPESGESPDAYLPSVMTCANYLKLPDYSTKAVMRQRLLIACEEGQASFLLS